MNDLPFLHIVLIYLAGIRSAFGRLQGKNGMSRYMENNDEEGWD